MIEQPEPTTKNEILELIRDERSRLVPIIGEHYLIDLFTGFLVGVLPLLNQ